MVVDTSALVAILLGESEREAFEDLILRSVGVVTSSVALVEAELILRARLRDAPADRLDRFLLVLGISTVAFDDRQASFAHEGARIYGRGRHPAKLNFGDCLVYGLAKARSDTLLFKGDDFALTDIEPAWRPAAEG